MRIRLNRTNIRNLESKSSSYYVADIKFPAFRVRTTPKGTKTFYLLYRNQQNRQITFKIGKFGELTPEQARTIAEKKMAGIKLGGDPAAEKQKAIEKAEHDQYSTLRAFLKYQFSPWAKANRKTGEHMVKRIESSFPEFLDYRLDAITPWLVEKWRKKRVEDSKTTGTINRDIATLKSCLSRAVDWGFLEDQPLRRVKLAKEDHGAIVRYLSSDEERRLREALTTRDQQIIAKRQSANQWRRERGYKLKPEIQGYFGDHLTPMALLSLNTGMRRGEVFHLHWSDIDFPNESLAIRGEKAKSGKTRHIPLNSEAHDTLKSWQSQQENSSELVFPGRNGKPLDNIYNAWYALLEAAKIENFRWHDIRHHFASRLVMAGVDLNTVRELLGHSDFKLTLRYAHLAPEHKAAAVAKLVEVIQ